MFGNIGMYGSFLDDYPFYKGVQNKNGNFLDDLRSSIEYAT